MDVQVRINYICDGISGIIRVQYDRGHCDLESWSLVDIDALSPSNESCKAGVLQSVGRLCLTWLGGVYYKTGSRRRTSYSIWAGRPRLLLTTCLLQTDKYAIFTFRHLPP